MTFANMGMDISKANGVKRGGNRVGESTSGIITSATVRQTERDAAPVEVVVKATLVGDTYDLVVTCDGETGEFEGGDLDNLGEVIEQVAKAARAGSLKKHRQSDALNYGLGAPRANRATTVMS